MGVTGDGNTDDSMATQNALADASSDTIIIPKGSYKVDMNITVSASKKFVFSAGAMLKPVNGVTITINGTWDANSNNQIFDFSLGGVIAGDFKIAEIYPEWLGAIGDGVTDDAKAFNDAMTLCAKKGLLVLGVMNYLVKSTIENNARGIRGVGKYTYSGNSGTRITFDLRIIQQTFYRFLE